MEASLDRDPRRAEVADLLRSRRQQLTAESVGLPFRTRRRTPGLRREEVAERAGISVALYSWLEQGRDVPVSRRTIDAIADALQFSSGERAHLQTLVFRDGVELREEVTPNLRRFVHALRGPAFVLDRGWDIVLRNVQAVAVFGGGDDLDERGNMLVELFADPERASLFTDPERVAESVVAMFRLDYAARIDDPRTLDLVEHLRAASPAFEAAWQQHKIREHPEGVREIVHPIAGVLKLVPSIYSVAESPGLRIMAFDAADRATAERLERLTNGLA
jgi:transcriptional regulator with XRE-family HTH domain